MADSILIWAHLDAPAEALLRAGLKDERVHFANDVHPTAADTAALADADIIYGNVPPALLGRCRRLRWLQLESVGFEGYPEAADPGLTVTNLKGMFEWPAAETALAGLLALGRGLRRLVPAQARRHWIEPEVRPESWVLHGRRAVVLGAGSIGGRVARLLRAFECDVQVFARRNPEATLRTAAQLRAAVAQSDVIVCCLPSTPRTAGLVSRELLAAMPRSAIFVNIGRGAVVDETALVEALQQGRLAGAVIDVTLAEPLPATHPLWDCPNTLLTQHTGGGYREELADKARIFLTNLARERAGQPLLNRVDLHSND